MRFRSRVIRSAAFLSLLIVILAGSAGCGGNQEASDSTPREPQFVERTLLVRATAYNSTPAQTLGDPDEAAWGDTLRPGMRAIAISPDLLSHGLRPGTAVRIEGLPGSFQVIDKTAGRMDRHIDIYMGRNVRDAREWGVQEVRISWLEPLPESVDPAAGAEPESGANTGRP